MFFSTNLHALDRLARLVLGVLMMVAGWSAEDGVPAFALRLFAFYPLVTGLVGWSPLYELLNFRTNHPHPSAGRPPTPSPRGRGGV